jgi:hypothetical protein
MLITMPGEVVTGLVVSIFSNPSAATIRVFAFVVPIHGMR